MFLKGGCTRAGREQQDAAESIRALGKIYVPDAVRAELGDDWNSLRKQAWGAGLYFTARQGFDTTSIEDIRPEEIPGYDYSGADDPVGMIKHMIWIMQEARTERWGQENYTDLLRSDAGDEAVDAYIDEMEDRMGELLSGFAAAADMEIEMRQIMAKNATAAANERIRRQQAVREQMRKKQERVGREKIMNDIRRLSRMRNKTSPEFRQQIDAAIGSIDTVARSITPAGLENLQDLRAAYEDAREKAGKNFLPNAWVEKRLGRLDQIQLDSMDFADVVELGKLVSGITKTITDQNEMLGEARNEQIYAAAKQIDTELRDGAKLKGATNKLAYFINRNQLAPRRFLAMLSGWQGGMLEKLGEDLEAGQTKMLDHQMKASQLFDSFCSDKENQEWLKKASGKDAEFISYTVMGQRNGVDLEDTAVTIEITPMMRVALYMHARNADNLRHIRDGGIRVPDKTLYLKGNEKNALASGVTVKLEPESVRKIAADATAREKAFAAVLEKYYSETSAEAINRVSMELDGFERAGMPNYYPIETDELYRAAGADRMMKYREAEDAGHIVNERKGGTNPIILRDASATFGDMVEDNSKYIGLSIPVRNFNAVLPYTFHQAGSSFTGSTAETLRKGWGAEAGDYLNKMLEDMQSGHSEQDEISRPMNALKSKLAGATLMFNPSVALSQTASYPGAMQTVGADGLLQGLKLWKKVDTSLIARYTPLYWYRNQGYVDTEMAAYTDDFDWGKKAPWVFGWIQKMDSATIRRIWAAAEYRVTKDTGLTPGNAEAVRNGTDEYYLKVAEVFNRAVYDTQPNYTTFQQSQVQRSHQVLTKMLTMFKTVPLQYYGMAVEAAGRLQSARAAAKAAPNDAYAAQRYSEARTYAANTYAGLIAANGLYVAMKLLFKVLRRRDDDYRDDEGRLWGAATWKQLGKDFITTCAGSVIFADEALSIAESIIKRIEGDTGSWEAPELSAMEYLTDIFDAVGGVIDGIHDLSAGEGGVRQLLGGIKDAVETGLKGVAGLPAENIETYLLSVISWVYPKASQEYSNLFGEVTKTKLTGLRGRNLTAAVEVLMENRAGELDGDVTDELTRLYGAGFTGVIPANIETEFNVTDVDGSEAEFDMSASDRAAWSKTWSGIISEALPELMASQGYSAADDETRERMIKKLYDYAKEMARQEISAYEIGTQAAGIEAAVEAGVPAAAAVEYIVAASAITGDRDESGRTVSGSAAQKKAQYIDGMDLTDGQKYALYSAMQTEEKQEVLSDYVDSGISEGDVVELASDGYSFSAKDRYFDFESAMSSSAALEVKSILGGLEPESGKDSVTTLQRYGAIAGTGKLTEKEKSAALGVLMGTETTTESGALSTYGKLQAVLEAGGDTEDWYEMYSVGADGSFVKLSQAGTGFKNAKAAALALSALEPEGDSKSVTAAQKYRAITESVTSEADMYSAMSTVMNESAYAKLTVAYRSYGVSPEAYTEYITTADMDGNGAVNQSEAAETLQGIPGLTAAQRAALWQLANKSWKPKSNPYSVSVGQTVWDEMNRE